MDEATSFGYRLGQTLAAPSRIALFGFLLVRPGVPFLPHDNAGALALTVLIAVAVSIPVRRADIAILVVIGVMPVVLLVLKMDAPTTSMVLVGSIIQAITRAADNTPFVYGFVAATAAGAVALQVFDPQRVGSDSQLLLSHERWTADRLSHQILLMTGLLFLTAIINVTRQEMRKFQTQAETAEAARDAAVADERARIARELHDVVSHHVTAMTLQAEAAALTGDKTALASVASAGREALTELRRMLGVLRRPSTGETTEVAEPQPSLADLDRLAARTREGLAVTVQRTGDVRDLPAGIELCVYRLVQEALTNAVKHGDATAVEVVLSFGASMLTVEITDNGRPLVAPRVRSGGLGLVGMEERVSLLDGELATGPRAGGNGFRVVARLPLEQ